MFTPPIDAVLRASHRELNGVEFINRVDESSVDDNLAKPVILLTHQSYSTGVATRYCSVFSFMDIIREETFRSKGIWDFLTIKLTYS